MFNIHTEKYKIRKYFSMYLNQQTFRSLSICKLVNIHLDYKQHLWKRLQTLRQMSGWSQSDEKRHLGGNRKSQPCVYHFPGSQGLPSGSERSCLSWHLVSIHVCIPVQVYKWKIANFRTPECDSGWSTPKASETLSHLHCILGLPLPTSANSCSSDPFLQTTLPSPILSPSW